MAKAKIREEKLDKEFKRDFSEHADFFEALKKQTEAMLENDDFVQEMQKAFTEMGPGMSQAAAAIAGGGAKPKGEEAEEDDEE